MLVLSGRLALYPLSARGGLAPRTTDAHWVGAHCPIAGAEATPAGALASLSTPTAAVVSIPLWFAACVSEKFRHRLGRKC